MTASRGDQRHGATLRKREAQGQRFKAPVFSMRSWGRAHRRAAEITLRGMLRDPVSTLITIAMLGVALALPAAFYLFLQNVQRLSGSWDAAASVSLYLDLELAEEQALQMADEIRGRQDVASVDYVSREQALEEFQAQSGLAELIHELQENPLPPVLMVRPLDANHASALREALAEQAGVAHAQLDLAWLERLRHVMALAARVGEGLALLLGFAVLLVVGNTVRLLIERQRESLAILDIVGATRAYLQRPMLYLGAIYGGLGGLLAWLYTLLGIAWLSVPVSHLATAYQSEYQLTGLSPADVGLLLLFSVLLGWLGAWIAVRRHLALTAA